MKANQTFISLKEMRDFYKVCCDEKGTRFSKKEFETFVDCCERDFYQWLRDNFKFFSFENPTATTNTTE